MAADVPFGELLLRTVANLACERGRLGERFDQAFRKNLSFVAESDVPEELRERWTKVQAGHTKYMAVSATGDLERAETVAYSAAAEAFDLFLVAATVDTG